MVRSERGLGAVGLARLRARVGGALDGIDLAPLERQDSIPLNPQQLASLASRVAYWRDRAGQAEDGYSGANALAREFLQRIEALERQLAAVGGVNRELSEQLQESAGVPMAEFAPDDRRDDGVAQLSHCRPTASALVTAIEARLAALEGEPAPAGMLPRCPAEGCGRAEGHSGDHSTDETTGGST